MINENEQDVLNNIDKFETIECGNLELVENCYYMAMFNGKWSYSDVEANAKEGWIRVFVWNYNSDKPPIKDLKRKFMPAIPDPYLIFKDGKPEVAYTKLFGDVLIFKTNPITGELIKKDNNETQIKST
jgi:hypothetical protein